MGRAPPRGPGGRPPEAGDGPPWQRGTPRPQQPPPRQNEPPTEKRPGGGAEARLNRFISGTAAPGTASHAKEPERGEGPPAEAYASELPDLSGPVPRGPHRKPAAERGAETTGGQGGGRPVSGESREGRDNRDRVQVSRRTRGPVRASMQIRRIDPWSTLKVSLLLSVALFFVWMIAVAFLYLVLGGMGVWSKLNSNVGDLLNNTSGSSGELVSSGTIFGGAVLIGLVLGARLLRARRGPGGAGAPAPPRRPAACRGGAPTGRGRRRPPHPGPLSRTVPVGGLPLLGCARLVR